MPGPVGDRPALDVAGADGDVEALLERRHQRGQRGGVVGEVGVDLDEGVVAALEAPGEARPVGAPQPGLGGAGEQVHVGQLGGDRLHEVGRAVGTPVVDHQHAGTGQALVDPVQHPLDVLRLVVGRDDHQRSHGGILGEAAAPAPAATGAAAGPGPAPGLVGSGASARSRPGGPSDVDRLRRRQRTVQLGGLHDGIGAPAQLPDDHLDGPAERGCRPGRPTKVPSPPATRPPSVAPTSTAMSTQKGFSRTVLLMMTGLRTWFSTCW